MVPESGSIYEAPALQCLNEGTVVGMRSQTHRMIMTAIPGEITICIRMDHQGVKVLTLFTDFSNMVASAICTYIFRSLCQAYIGIERFEP